MQWLKDWIPANKAVCGSSVGVASKSDLAAKTAHPGLVVRDVNGRLVTGFEKDGQVRAVTALGAR